MALLSLLRKEGRCYASPTTAEVLLAQERSSDGDSLKPDAGDSLLSFCVDVDRSVCGLLGSPKIYDNNLNNSFRVVDGLAVMCEGGASRRGLSTQPWWMPVLFSL